MEDKKKSFGKYFCKSSFIQRSMPQVYIEDASQAEDTFTVLMGDLVQPRKEFIQTNALMVRNLDI